MKQEISFYDKDPEIQRVRVADWVAGLDWRTFELEVAVLYKQMGYVAWATSPSGDGGVDVRARKGGSKVIIQCKHWKNRVGVDIVKAFHATKEDENASLAVLVTSSSLEPGANRWAMQHDVEVIDGTSLVELFHKYCDPTRPIATPVESHPHQDFTLFEEHPQPAPRPQRVPLPDLSEKDRSVLDLVKEKTQIQNKDVQDLLGLSRAVAGARLKKLVDRFYLTMHGTKAVAYYTTVGTEQSGSLDTEKKPHSADACDVSRKFRTQPQSVSTGPEVGKEQGLLFEAFSGNQSQRKASDVSAREIKEAIIAVLKRRPNNSIAIKALTKEVCRELYIRTRGNPLLEFDKRVKGSVRALKQKGLVKPTRLRMSGFG